MEECVSLLACENLTQVLKSDFKQGRGVLLCETVLSFIVEAIVEERRVPASLARHEDGATARPMMCVPPFLIME